MTESSEVKVLTHLKPPRRLSMLFFEVLPFTDDVSVVNGKTSKKSMKKTKRRFLVCQDLYLEKIDRKCKV